LTILVAYTTLNIQVTAMLLARRFCSLFFWEYVEMFLKPTFDDALDLFQPKRGVRADTLMVKDVDKRPNNSQQRDLEEKITAIDGLDLSMIKMKLCLPIEQEGKGWSTDQTDNCERLYKMFLKLNIMHPSASVVPTKEIDEMWHAHILDTRKYHADCQKVFGFYFHHFPYFGLRGEEDKANLYSAFEATKSLFLKHFGEDLTKVSEGATTCGNRNCNGCRNSDP